MSSSAVQACLRRGKTSLSRNSSAGEVSRPPRCLSRACGCRPRTASFITWAMFIVAVRSPVCRSLPSRFRRLYVSSANKTRGVVVREGAFFSFPVLMLAIFGDTTNPEGYERGRGKGPREFQTRGQQCGDWQTPKKVSTHGCHQY